MTGASNLVGGIRKTRGNDSEYRTLNSKQVFKVLWCRMGLGIPGKALSGKKSIGGWGG